MDLSDLANITLYDGANSGDRIDEAISAAMNPDAVPDATHTNALISSAGVANAISAAVGEHITKGVVSTSGSSFNLADGTAYLVLVQSGQNARASLNSVYVTSGGVCRFVEIFATSTKPATVSATDRSGDTPAALNVTSNAGNCAVSILAF